MLQWILGYMCLFELWFSYLCVCACASFLPELNFFSNFVKILAFVVESLSHVWLFVTPLTVAHQAPLSMGFSRQEYCSGLPFPSPGDLLDPGIKPLASATSPTLQVDSLLLSHWRSPLIKIFNWRIIALQYCVVFSHTSTWISHRHTYVPSLEPPSRP